MSRETVLRATQLEVRAVPAGLTFLFDFRFDDLGFFTDNPDRIAVLQAAAQDLASRFSDQLAAIPFPSVPTNSWKAKFQRPSGFGQDEELVNPIIPANAVLVFVGASDVGVNEFFEVSSSREVFGDAAWNELVLGRGQPNSFGPAATDFSPWGGSVSFETFADWHFGIDPPGNPDEVDFFMTAQKALMHVLGFGASEAWNRVGATGQFFGTNAVGVFGGPVPLTGGNFEWQEDVLSQGQRTLMDADLEDGERIYPTALDLAAMQDIGWQEATVPTPPPPPAADRPPVLSPAPIRAGTELFAVGAGPGLDSRFTVNAAAQFVQLAEFNPYQSYASGGEAFSGGSRVVTADVNADGVEDLIVGPGPGIPTEVKVFSGANFPVEPESSLVASGFAFEQSFTGGLFLAAGDVDGDGVADVAISPDEGGGPRVILVSGRTRARLADFFGIDDPNFRGGARTALGDLNGDGTPDLIVGAGFGGGPRVAAFDGTTLRPGQTPRKLFNDFFVFEPELRNGAFLTAGDVDGDGFADLIAGGGPGGGPRVLALSGRDLTDAGTTAPAQLANFFAGDTSNRGGVTLAAKFLDEDGKADLVTGAGSGAQSVVTTYLGKDLRPNSTPPARDEFLIFDPSFTGGVYVG